MPQIKQKDVSHERTRQIEEQKARKTIDQAPENPRKTDVIEELKRKSTPKKPS